MLMTNAPASTRPVRGGHLETSVSPQALLPSFAGLRKSNRLLLAVSGGADSMALLLTAACWQASLGVDAPGIHVATVDHGLRRESRAEAEQVAAIAGDFNLPHAVLTWTGEKPTARVQERAREARYRLLVAHARAIDASHILTAHHADDQAETVLLRLARGSGVTGLGGMRRVTTLAPGIDLVRPFLDVSKAELVAVCRAEACAFVDDPSNRDPAYARARLRTRGAALSALGFNTSGLTRLARRLARADAAIEAEVDRVEASLAPEREAATYRVDLSGAVALEPEIVLRLLGRAVRHVAGDRALRLERLEALVEAIQCALSVGNEHRGTIAGTRVKLERQRVLKVTREGARRRGLQDARPSLLRPN